jgi:hypothetical protein
LRSSGFLKIWASSPASNPLCKAGMCFVTSRALPPTLTSAPSGRIVAGLARAIRTSHRQGLPIQAKSPNQIG